MYQADKLSVNPDSSSETGNSGGSAGIGRAVALGLSDNGAIVTVLARRKDRLDAVVQQLHEVILCFVITANSGSVCMTRLLCGQLDLCVCGSIQQCVSAWQTLASAGVSQACSSLCAAQPL